MRFTSKTGLYNPEFEKDSCGVGFIADIKGRKSRRIIDLGLSSMCNLEHRGAVGADERTGDGAGILIQMPDRFFRKETAALGFQLPKLGRYAVGFMYLPRDPATRKAIENLIEKVSVDEGCKFLGWRDVPTDPSVAGVGARRTMPYFRQCFLEANKKIKDTRDFERKLYLIRRVIDRRVREEYKLARSEYYVPSFSSKTIIYKGMLLGDQLQNFYPDLRSEDLESALILHHTRFSTNTFPTWDLAHPFRMIAHNGEINTLKGNKNWMAARQMVMESPYYGKDLRRMLPIVMAGQSDSATFDSVLELLYTGGRELPHAVMMMIPEAWSKNKQMDPARRAFYEYHANLMEPWDGPAAIAFTDGNVIGATLDRNGLRPSRFMVTRDDLVILSSEMGSVPVAPEDIVSSRRLQPGKMLLIDLSQHRIIEDDEIKKQMASRRPYADWLKKNLIRLSDLPEPFFVHPSNPATLLERQRAMGYTNEEIFQLMIPMATAGEEPVGSMGVDAALAILSEKPQPLFRYFKQQFAQVTNPPIDPIREELVMELTTYVGPEQNLLDETPEHAHRLELETPILTNHDLEKIRNIAKGHFNAITIELLFDPSTQHAMRNRLDQVCEEVSEAVRKGTTLIILSDRGVTRERAAIPSLLAVSAVHHSLIRAGLRTKTGIIIETAEPRENSHFALLVGYGANAIHPYLAFETLDTLCAEGLLTGITDPAIARKNYIKSIGKGLFKVFSKMGISTLQSYCGAQIFEAIGLDSELVNLYFTGTSSRLEGMSVEMLEQETVRRHCEAYDPLLHPGTLDTGGLHHYRKTGEEHLYSPMVIHKLQRATRENSYPIFKEYSQLVNGTDRSRVTLRSLFELDHSARPPVPIEEVEPVTEILKRFSTGAMSFGSISWEAHTQLAIAMNRIGGKSNTGEGGEDAIRYQPLPNGDSMRSAIKQVASARFGVTANYLVNADDLQIKLAQGAKPGEGGQLPGHKVDAHIARLRYSTPGVTLISPPPHHDIYSIEDLKQLIFDLKNINPSARISVKLVSESGVGTIAAGVVKARADHVLISGHDGGTGASPVSSIHFAGTPWELGLAEAHQTLVINGLRDRVVLATDGKLLTGRDVVIATLLGAEEFGFSTTPLISLGCIMMRKCHLNTCPVGVATQDPELRSKYTGKAEYVVHFMQFVAEEVREHMAALGYRKFNEMIGQVERIIAIRATGSKARGLDFTKVLTRTQPLFPTDLYHTKNQNHELESQIDHELIRLARPAIDHRIPVTIQMPIRNINRTIGTLLSGEVARKYGEAGLPDGSVNIELSGNAGQSFGAFLSPGIQMVLTGQSNDYAGKGLSGGRIVVRVPEKTKYDPAKNIIVGNTCLYGATSGEAYFQGVAGERFAVRNSGASAVVEGVGDHGCEYMTGGRVVVLGLTGRNFAAGMSGGIAYVWDEDGSFASRVNAGMIDLDRLEEANDEAEVQLMIEQHQLLTGSARAKEILKNWKKSKSKFVKVIPRDYKLALKKTEITPLKSVITSPGKKVETPAHG